MEVNISNQVGLDALLTVKITEADYKEDFEKSLKENGRKMNVPGFRPGKVPTGVVKKMIGKGVRHEVVEKLLQKSIQDYLDTNNVKLVLSPLSAYHAEDIDWQNDDFEFTYDIGYRPEIKLDLKPLNKLPKYKVALSDENVKNDVGNLRRQAGKFGETPVYTYAEDFYAGVTFTELDDKGEVLEGGLEKTKRYSYKNIPEKLAALLNGKSVNDHVDIKLSDIFSGDEVATQFEIDAASAADLFDSFRATLISVMTVQLPEMDEDFFKTYFPEGNVTTEEEFYGAWRAIMESYYDSQANNILAKAAKKTLVDEMKEELPLQFVKKYFLLSYEVKDDLEIEDYDKKYDAFTEELKWLVLAEYITEENNIEITEEEVINYTEDMLHNELTRSGQYNVPGEKLRQYAIDYLTKENNFNRTSMALRDGKVFDWLVSQIIPVTEEVSLEKFEEIRNNH